MKRRINHAHAIRSTCTPVRVTHVAPPGRGHESSGGDATGSAVARQRALDRSELALGSDPTRCIEEIDRDDLGEPSGELGVLIRDARRSGRRGFAWP